MGKDEDVHEQVKMKGSENNWNERIEKEKKEILNWQLDGVDKNKE